MRYVLEHSDCRVVVAAPEWEERVRAALAGVDRDGASRRARAPTATLAALQQALPRRGDAAPAPPVPAEATALLMYTSGTTGVPKGVMLTQANLAANAGVDQRRARARARPTGCSRCCRSITSTPSR